jgi:hypothetical protein
VVIISVLVAATLAQSNVVSLSFTDVNSYPRALTVPRGTVLEFSGPVKGDIERGFYILAGTNNVARGSFRKEWRLRWDTSAESKPELPVEVLYYEGTRSISMARIRLTVLQSNPFSLADSFNTARGDLQLEIKGASPGLTAEAEYFIDGVSVGRAKQLTYTIEASAVPPGQHDVSAIVHLPYGVQMRVPSKSIEIPALCQLKAATPAQVILDLGNKSESAAGSAVFGPFEGATLKALFANKKEVGSVSSNTWSVPLASLEEGRNELRAQIATQDGRLVWTDVWVLDIKWTPKFALVKNGRSVLAQMNDALPVFLRVAAIVMEARKKSEEEDLYLYENGRVTNSVPVGTDPSRLVRGDRWDIMRAVAKETSAKITEKPSLALDPADNVMLKETLDGIRLLLEKWGIVSDILGDHSFVNLGDEPKQGKAHSRKRAEDIWSTAKLTTECRDAAKAALRGREALSKSIGEPAPALDNRFESIVAIWPKRNLAKITFFHWLESIHTACAKVGSPEHYPLNEVERFLALCRSETPEALARVASELQKRFIIQEFDLRGYSNNDAMGQATAEMLVATRPELGSVYATAAQVKRLMIRLDQLRQELRDVEGWPARSKQEADTKAAKMAQIRAQIEATQRQIAQLAAQACEKLSVLRKRVSGIAEDVMNGLANR